MRHDLLEIPMTLLAQCRPRPSKVAHPPGRDCDLIDTCPYQFQSKQKNCKCESLVEFSPFWGGRFKLAKRLAR
jgi:hypothetical protein